MERSQRVATQAAGHECDDSGGERCCRGHRQHFERYDVAGHEAFETMSLTLHCDGDGACDGQCTDLDNNSQHCGSCGQAVPPGQLCSGGEPACYGSDSPCGSACVDLETDEAHCGSCNNDCGSLPGPTFDPEYFEYVGDWECRSYQCGFRTVTYDVGDPIVRALLSRTGMRLLELRRIDHAPSIRGWVVEAARV